MNKRFVSILLALMLTLAMVLPAMADGANTITLQAISQTDHVFLSWTPVTDTSGFSGYYVYRSTQPGSASGTPAHDFWLTTTTFADRNVEKGVIYYYTVRPVYGATIGSPSNEVQSRVGSLGVTIIMEIANSTMLVNDVAKPVDPTSPDVVPELRYGRTFVPIRAVVEALGGTVAYDANTRMVTITLDNNSVNMWIGKNNFEVNGVNKVMDIAPYIYASRTYLPLRFVLENLNCTTEWNGETHRIMIKRVPLTGGTGQVSGPSVPGNVTPGTPGNLTPGSTTPGAGNTGSTDKPTFNPGPPDINGPSVPGTLEPPKQLLNWTGRWDTNFGILVLTQNGNQVTGTYPNGTLTGTASQNASGNNILTGTFDEGDGYYGPFTFTMSADGRSFTGTWHYIDNTDDSPWFGTRVTN